MKVHAWLLAGLVVAAALAAGCIASIGGGPALPDARPDDWFAGARFEIANFSAAPEGGGYEDERVHVQFVVENRGDTMATRFATLRFAGEIVDVVNVTLAPGAHTRAYRYAFVPGAPGPHAFELTVGERRATLEVALQARPRPGAAIDLGPSGLVATLNALQPEGNLWRLNLTIEARSEGAERLVARALCGSGPDGYREGPGLPLSWPGAGESLVHDVHLQGCAGGVVGFHLHHESAGGDGFARWLLAPTA